MAKFKILTTLLCIASFATKHTLGALPLPDNYDSSTRPNQGSVADVVNVSADVLAIRGVHEDTSEMTVDISMHTSWVDSRLFGLVPRETLFVDEQIPHIWRPNVQIANADSSVKGSNQVLQMNRDGLINLSEKKTVKISCPISQAKYPFDKQLCKLQINSYGYSNVHLKLFWNGKVSPNVPTYHTEFSFSHAEQTSENIKTQTGAEYSNLYLEIAVSRCPLRVIFRAMLPTLVLVILSYYVSFCHCPLLKGVQNKTKTVETPALNGTHNHSNSNNHHSQYQPGTSSNSVDAAIASIRQQAQASTSSNSHSPSPTFGYSASPVGGSGGDPCMPLSSPSFNLFLVTINGTIFILGTFIAQINFIEAPKASAVSGLDVWLNFMSAILFIVLWHSIQLYFNILLNEHSRESKNSSNDDSCYVNRTTSFLKLGIPLVLAVFLVIYFGIYLS